MPPDHPDDLSQRLAALDIPLNRDVFMRTLVREMTNVLCDVVGLEQAAGFVAVVGQSMGRQIDQNYRQALQLPKLSREQVAAVLVDLKKRIQGDFYIVEQNDERIVLKNRVCPFEDKVQGQRALCMMTSNVFGCVSAENLGYAKVELRQTIAEGAPECEVVVHLNLSDETDALEGREYFKTTS
ncbi:MAG: hypothetical protein KBD60_04870 [Sterolibacterium sp.]|jgi:predicted ArsR family transcriptional regulator|nr:hypothetical protein [Sterolibacterium sp.]